VVCGGHDDSVDFVAWFVEDMMIDDSVDL